MEQGDSRNIAYGLQIPAEAYCDQPYVVQTDDGAWLCVITTGTGEEGEPGQKVVMMRSQDRGRSWSEPVALEPPGSPENSYAVLLKVPYGRVYCFYNYNGDNQRELKTEDGRILTRVDSLGQYVFRYSDNHGVTWSAQRYVVPVREFAYDRENVYGGAVRFFWNVGRPLLDREIAYLTLHKVGAMGAGFFAQSEGAILRSDNIAQEHDPERLEFLTLPDGDVGLRTPVGGGRIAEEQCITALSDGSLYCVYRTVDGHPACSYSRDGGHTWSPPQYKTYTPGGRRFKHPRAANFVWKCRNGKYLYWFHNHGVTTEQRRAGWNPYANRNPAWLSCGEERDSPDGKILVWSQPEILLYADDPTVRISYPDLIETEDGQFYITETQKTIARLHPLGPLTDLFSAPTASDVCKTGLRLTWERTEAEMAEVPIPTLPPLDRNSEIGHAGFTLELAILLTSEALGQVLLDTRTPEGQGIAVVTGDGGAITLEMSDGTTQFSWSSDRNLVSAGAEHNVTIIVEAGPKLVLFVVDGLLCDGGEERQFGWGRFPQELRDINGSVAARIASSVHWVRLYDCALRVNQAVANQQANQGE